MIASGIDTFPSGTWLRDPRPEILMSANISHSIRFAKGLFVKISTSHGLTAGYADDLFERILDDHPFWVELPKFRIVPRP